MNLTIRTEGSKYLRKKTISLRVNKSLSEKKLKLISDMKETLASTNGVGLAAPQVGSRDRIFIVSYEDFEQTFINPIFRVAYGDDVEDIESCLSVPNRAIKVPRPDQIKLEYYDENLAHNSRLFKGFLARIIQHEYDHLEGKLITDYL
jgi:peptide deformylase